MASAVLTALLLGQLVSTGQHAELMAVAASSPRPEPCYPGGRADGSQRQTRWDQARTPGLQAYCVSLARGYGRLRTNPSGALLAAQSAERILPGQAAPLALRGRALERLGRTREAFDAFTQARRISERSLDAPTTLHAFALAAAQSGHGAEARQVYQKLVPQAALLPSEGQRQRAYVEAAIWAMTDGEKGLDEAIGYLGEARRRGLLPDQAPFVLGALALALDRQGQGAEARGVAAEAGGAAALVMLFGPPDGDSDRPGPTTERSALPRAAATVPWIVPAEQHAMIAELAEDEDRNLAREHWAAFLELNTDPQQSPWLEHARAKLRALSTVSGRRRGR